MPPADISDTSQVFLSYSRNDLDAAISLRTELQRTGLSVFKDDDAIRTGDRWITRLGEALQDCSAFVLLVGRDGVRGWVGAEVDVALIRQLSTRDEEKRLPIFPILLEEAQVDSLPIFLTRIQADRWSPTEALPDGLVAAIKERKARRSEQQVFEGCPFLGLDGIVTLSDWRDNPAMNKSDNPYYRHRFPLEVISHAVWLYHRFTLSFRDIEEILAIRGIQTSYESIRRWCLKFPRKFTKSLRKRQGKLGDIWYLDEVFSQP